MSLASLCEVIGHNIKEHLIQRLNDLGLSKRSQYAINIIVSYHFNHKTVSIATKYPDSIDLQKSVKSTQSHPAKDHTIAQLRDETAKDNTLAILKEVIK